MFVDPIYADRCCTFSFSAFRQRKVWKNGNGPISSISPTDEIPFQLARKLRVSYYHLEAALIFDCDSYRFQIFAKAATRA